jgi:acyl-CoA synthetase (AMP-forming)/AMP-acid ligase II
VIRIHDDPIPRIADAPPLASGEIGELVVRGPVVTRAYVTRTDANPFSKIADADHVWHRMGDVGYLDEQDRFWFCGRKSQRVETTAGPLYTEPCETIFNQHPAIFRSALVAIGPRGKQVPGMICEPWPGKFPRWPGARRRLLEQLHQLAQSHALTREITRERLWLWRRLPVDVRHNAKISREQLAAWAERRV